MTSKLMLQSLAAAAMALSSTGCVGLTIDGNDTTAETSGSGSGSGSGESGEEGRQMIQGGNSWGECAGACRFEISFGGDEAELVISDWGGSTPMATNYGSFTSEGRAMVEGVEESLSMASLQDIYGCPDCADGGASWVRLNIAGFESTHQYEYGNAPAELSEFDTLLQDFVTALRSCEASAWIEPDEACVPQM